MANHRREATATHFTGLFSPNSTYITIDNTLCSVGVFFATNRPPAVKTTHGLHSQEILEAVAKNPDPWACVAATARQLDKQQRSTVGGIDIGECLHIVVFPSKTAVLGDKIQNTVRFEPSKITTLRAVIAKFGEPTEKEMWLGPLAAQVGLQNLVYWWDGVGIATGTDDTITHVLTREQMPESTVNNK